MGEASIEGIEEVRASEIYPKKPLHCEGSSCSIPYSPLPGESPLYSGDTSDGTIVLSNYRLYVSASPFINIPLGLIEQVECRDIVYIYIYCKDARSFRCTFSGGEKCQDWLRRIQKAVLPSNKLDNHFSFVFYLWSLDEHKEDVYTQLQRGVKEDPNIPDLHAEAERMGFRMKSVWKISEVNSDYSLCPSYPRHIIVPASVSDKDLKIVSGFRYSKRIPAVVWRHQQNGCVIARCSQPEVGWFGSRRPEDENLIQAIADACICDPGLEQTCAEIQETFSMNSDLDAGHTAGDKSRRKLLIIDARSYTAAVANRAKGGGCECVEYYPNCEVQFLGLANIHSIRKSFMSLRTLCASAPDQQTWLSSLEGTKWLQHIGGLIHAALLVVNAVDVEKRPVVVHCSDGWDRTPQIVALAELMMDPYYRTKEGFRILVEREWLEFGHKFADRCGHSTGTSDLNERSPVFLQWLDCVHQLLDQFPCYFEFNSQFLVKLIFHTYSCLFGTFLCNTDQERKMYRIQERTFSVWSFLSVDSHFHNFLFNNSTEVLRPSCQVKDLHFWSDVFMPADSVSLGKPTVPQQEMCTNAADGIIPLVKTKSCDDISSMDHPSGLQRRSSDPSIVKNVSLPECSSFSAEETAQPHVGSSRLPLDNNGNLNVNRICPDRVQRTKCKSKSVSCSNLVCREPTIDGSTDTLVSENGIIPRVPSTEKVSGLSHLENFVPNGRVTCSVSTSTSDLLRAIENVPEALANADSSDSKWSPWCQAVLEAYLSCKKVNSSSSCSHSYTTPPHHSRTPSSGFPATPCDDTSDVTLTRGRAFPYPTLGIDGSVIVVDEIQEQLQKLITYYKRRIKNLECDLWAAQNDVMQQVCLRCQSREKTGLDGDDAASLADSVCSGEQRIEGSPGSDVSWEQLERPDRTLWVPDYASPQCTGCEAKFWTVKRRHHCRKCGQVFCSNCSSQMIPVPTEQLYDPVRVCNFCFAELQLRESVSACDKMPKAVITAASN